MLNEDWLPSDCLQIKIRYPSMIPLQRGRGILDHFILRAVELTTSQDTLLGAIPGAVKESRRYEVG